MSKKVRVTSKDKENVSPYLYQADGTFTTHVKKVRDTLVPLCNTHLHRHVRVETMDGHKYEGMIVRVDGGHLYLQVSPNRSYSSYYYNNVILPLVLFELLVITLL